MNSQIMRFVRRRLREEGHASFPRIAKATRRGVSLLKKIASGHRDNCRVETVEPIARHLGMSFTTDAKPKR